MLTWSSESCEMWFTAAYDSIFGLKWFIMALKHKHSLSLVLYVKIYKMSN